MRDDKISLVVLWKVVLGSYFSLSVSNDDTKNNQCHIFTWKVAYNHYCIILPSKPCPTIISKKMSLGSFFLIIWNWSWVHSGGHCWKTAEPMWILRISSVSDCKNELRGVYCSGVIESSSLRWRPEGKDVDDSCWENQPRAAFLLKIQYAGWMIMDITLFVDVVNKGNADINKMDMLQ